MQSCIPYDLFAPTAFVPTTLTTVLNATGTWVAHSFLAQGKTLSVVRVYVSAVTGSPATSDITAELQASTGGAPSGTALETRTIDSIATGWRTWSGFTTALTNGAQYWIVIKNLHGTPSTNNVTIRGMQLPLVLLQQNTAAPAYGWWRRTTTDSGGAWANASTRGSIRVGYSDGSFDGIPWQDVGVTGATDGIYGAREVGLAFRTPPVVTLRVRGISFLVGAITGTPTGKLRYRLYTTPETTPSLVATTADIAPGGQPSNQYIHGFFASIQNLAPATYYMVTAGETTQSDTSGNRYNFRYLMPDTDPDSIAMFPWGGNELFWNYYDGSSWSSLTNRFLSVALLLDRLVPFG